MQGTSMRPAIDQPGSQAPRAASAQRLEPLRQIEAGVLDIAYYETGPADGPVVMLMHGFPYDIHSFVDVAPMLAAEGCRTIVPYLRGYGPTRFRDTGDAAFGRTGRGRRRSDGADGCARGQACGPCRI